VFLDAAYAIALAAPSDQLHSRAVILAQELEDDATHMVTTRAVLLEIGNALAKRRYRAAAVALLAALDADSSIEVVALSSELYTEAFALYR
jgi:predicted nucleic acid-binding protein